MTVGYWPELSAAGLKPEDADTVFLTHFYPDHVEWNTGGGADNSPSFPKARYVANVADVAAFKSP